MTNSPDPADRRWAIRPLPALLALLLVCIAVYLRGLFGGFVFDDFGAIVDNSSMRALDGSFARWLDVALSSNTGVLRRPLSLLSFGLNYYWFGLNPFAFKVTNLIIHLANGLLVYALAVRLIGRLLRGSADKETLAPALALAVAALWLLHPLSVGTVVYIFQRMNILMSLFMLLGLLCYAVGRERMLGGKGGVVLAFGGMALFGLLALFTKENGLLIVVYALVIEWFCFGFEASVRWQRAAVKIVLGLATIVPLAAIVAFLLVHPQWMSDHYAIRTYSMSERLLTEARVLCDYLLWIFVPNPQWMGIFHDDYAASTGLLAPPTTLFAIAFLAALVVSELVLRKRSPGYAFAVAWFLGGHIMESTIIPLELVFDHRNYLPMAGLYIGLAAAIGPWIRSRAPSAGFAACGAVALIFAAVTFSRATDWSSELRLAKSELAHHPESPRALYETGRQIIFAGTPAGHRDEAEKEAAPYFERALAIDNTDIFSASSLLIIKARNAPALDPDVDALAYATRHILQSEINPLLVVLAGAIQGSISISPQQFSRLAEAALDNPVYPPTMRAMVLNNYGHYQFQVLHNNQEAVSLTLAAATEDPKNALFQINLTKLALALGEADRASEFLGHARQLDVTHIYADAIADLTKRIEAAGSTPDH